MIVSKDSIIQNINQKIGRQRLIYIVIITSVMWFAIDVLLIIANDRNAVESLEKLTFREDGLEDSNFMKDVYVIPLAPDDTSPERKYLPWLKKFDKGNMKVDSESGKGQRVLYDNSKVMNYQPGLGEDGLAAYLTNDKDKALAEKTFDNHSFNSVLSERISLDRSLPDVRGEE